MPTRNNRTTSRTIIRKDGSVYYDNQTYYTWWLKGNYQNISSLNNTGTFIPGVFKANPVIIWKTCGYGDGASGPPSKLELSPNVFGTMSCEGDLALTLLAGIDVIGKSHTIAVWDSQRASNSLVKAYSKMNEPDLDVGVMLGELRETLSGLANPFSSLRKYAKYLNDLRYRYGLSYRRGRGAKASLDAASGTLLEIRYGLIPLIGSITDIIRHAESLEQALCGKLLRKRSKVSFLGTNKYDIPWGSISVLRAKGTATAQFDKQTTTSVFYKLARPLSLEERLGITPLDLPSVGWELLLLSFVWDWFIAVGDWLKAWQWSGIRTSHGCTTSQRTKIVWSASTSETQWNDYRLGYRPANVTDSCTLTYERLERRVNLPLPVFPPVTKEYLSVLRTLDSLALIWQRLPKWRK